MHRKITKPNCRECEYFTSSRHGVWKYCLHPKAACSVIHFEYQQQRRPEWCPLEEGHDGHQGN